MQLVGCLKHLLSRRPSSRSAPRDVRYPKTLLRMLGLDPGQVLPVQCEQILQVEQQPFCQLG